MSLQFIIGPAGSGKTTKLYEQIIERSLEFPNKTFLLVTPEQNNLSALKELLNKTPGKGILNIDVLGFNRLAHRIFDEAGGNDRQILDDTAKSLILRRLASLNRDKLSTLGANIDKPGYIQELKSVISEFMQYDIGISTLQSMLGANKENTVLYKKLSDISILYEEFKDYLKDRYITTEEVLDRAYELSGQAKFLENCEIYLDGFTGFTPVQVRFLSRLMQLCDRIVTTVIIGNDGDNELFGLGFKTIATLTKEAVDNQIKIESELRLDTVYRLKDNRALLFLEENLYRFNGCSMNLYEVPQNASEEIANAINALRKNSAEAITVSEYSNATDEIVSVAKQIAIRVRRGDIRYREFAVLTGNIEEYADEFEKELAKYDIPVYIDKNINVLLNPFAEIINAAIQCVATGYQYEKVIRFLRSGLCDFEPCQIDEIDNYLRAAGIKKLYQYKNEWKYKPRYMKEDDEKLVELNQYREKILESMQMLENKKKKAAEHAKDLYDFILVNGLYQKINSYIDYFKENDEASKIREYSQIYNSFMELLDKIVDFIGDEVISLSDFAKEIEAGLAAFNLGMIPPGVDRVVFGDLTRSRFDGIREMYILGCNEGEIPANNRKGGILSEDEREILCEQEFTLSPTSRELIAQDRFYIYMNLTKTKEALHISYPLMSFSGKTLMASSLIGELKKLYRDLFIARDGKKSEQSNTARGENNAKSSILTMDEALEILVSNSDLDEARKLFLLKKTIMEDEKARRLLKRLYQKQGKLSAVRKIPKDVARELYGRKFNASITRLELFSACPYAHFLKYGLSLKEVEEYGFASSDMGTIFHDTLQKYSELVRDSEYDWFSISESDCAEFLETALSFVKEKNRDSAIFETKRSEYMLSRIRRILKRTIDVMNIQIRKGSFEPYSYETSFGYDKQIKASDFVLSEDEVLTLQGRIDRVDLCKNDEKLFVKVIDYKSGSKNFSLANVYYGLSLQLVVYLGAAMEVHKKRNKNLEVNPAAILYYHVDDPLIDRPEGNNPEEIRELIIKELSTKGLVNADKNVVSLLDSEFTKASTVIPVTYTKDGFSKASSIATGEEIEIIQNYVNQYITQTGRSILDGEISVQPYKLKKKTGCDYCKYKNICQKDELVNNYRELDDLDRDEAIASMLSEMSAEKSKT